MQYRRGSWGTHGRRARLRAAYKEGSGEGQRKFRVGMR